MDIEKLKKNVCNIDWSKYNGPQDYEPNNVTEALISLIELTDSKKANEVANQIMYTIGNNHRGTYYPAIFSALDIIISLAKDQSNNARRVCANAILNNLYYFEPELGSAVGRISDSVMRRMVGAIIRRNTLSLFRLTGYGFMKLEIIKKALPDSSFLCQF